MLASMAAIVALSESAAPGGPGLGQREYSDAELWKIVQHITPLIVPREHGLAMMIDGYVVHLSGADGGWGGITVLEASDPDKVRQIKRIDDNTIRSSHGCGFIGKTLAAMGTAGVVFYDFSDPCNSVRISELKLPDVENSDYSNGVWWIGVNGSFVVVGAASRDLYIVDAANLRAPRLASRMRTTEAGSFRMGSVFPVGNLLVCSGNDRGNFSIIDIGGSLPMTGGLVVADGAIVTLLGGGRSTQQAKALSAYSTEDGRKLWEVDSGIGGAANPPQSGAAAARNTSSPPTTSPSSTPADRRRPTSSRPQAPPRSENCRNRMDTPTAPPQRSTAAGCTYSTKTNPSSPTSPPAASSRKSTAWIPTTK